MVLYLGTVGTVGPLKLKSLERIVSLVSYQFSRRSQVELDKTPGNARHSDPARASGSLRGPYKFRALRERGGGQTSTQAKKMPGESGGILSN